MDRCDSQGLSRQMPTSSTRVATFTQHITEESGAIFHESADFFVRGAQPPRLRFGAPSRRTFVCRAYCFDPHPRTAMPTTRASSAAPEAGALPIPTESQRSILVQNVAGHPGTGRVCLDDILECAAAESADGVDLAAHLCRREEETRCRHWRLCGPSV